MNLETALELARVVKFEGYRHKGVDYPLVIRLLLEHIEDLEQELRETRERN